MRRVRIFPPAERAIGPARGSETILLVEDEPAVRSVATRVLRNQGYFVLAACNGEEALALADKVGGAVDLVLTDVIMPDMGGPELVERIWAALARHSGCLHVRVCRRRQDPQLK